MCIFDKIQIKTLLVYFHVSLLLHECVYYVVAEECLTRYASFPINSYIAFVAADLPWLQSSRAEQFPRMTAVDWYKLGYWLGSQPSCHCWHIYLIILLSVSVIGKSKLASAFSFFQVCNWKELEVTSCVTWINSLCTSFKIHSSFHYEILEPKLWAYFLEIEEYFSS